MLAYLGAVCSKSVVAFDRGKLDNNGLQASQPYQVRLVLPCNFLDIVCESRGSEGAVLISGASTE